MNKPLTSEEIQHLLAGFVLNDLTPAEEATLRQLLRERPSLGKEIEDLQTVLGQVVEGYNTAEVPAHLLSNLLAAATGVPLAEILAPGSTDSGQAPIDIQYPRNKPRSWRKLLGGIVGSILALAVLALGGDYLRLRQDLSAVMASNRQLREDLAQARTVQELLQGPKARLFTLTASRPNPTSPASGSLILNAEQRRAMMILQNLPAPPTGKVYVLWVIIGGKKVTCGEVKPYIWGNAAYELPFTSEMMRDFYHPNFTGMVLTLENDPKVIRPAGPMVMQSADI